MELIFSVSYFKIVTAVLGSFGIASAGGGNAGIDLHVSIKGFTHDPML